MRAYLASPSRYDVLGNGTQGASFVAFDCEGSWVELSVTTLEEAHAFFDCARLLVERTEQAVGDRVNAAVIDAAQLIPEQFSDGERAWVEGVAADAARAGVDVAEEVARAIAEVEVA